MGTVEFDGEVFHKGISKVAADERNDPPRRSSERQRRPARFRRTVRMLRAAWAGRFFGFSRHRIAVADRAGRASFTLPVPSAGSVK